ncbi:unnamed protein product [Prorocentrum cordatum]|uniref:OBG-type G domain-containing protein n=1 Tax=Prorocentrum cordatum TaxID=2364126 RepID=A0ABN9TAK9_9DINO|nr:unnamed protein product [Polarella glacialis]
MSVLQKIADIEAEMARTQKNKATNAHLGLLKAKLAKLRASVITEGQKGSGGGGGAAAFEVSKTGDARVGLVGFPSVGKSTLLNKMTGQESEVASYEFTTLTCVPGIFYHKGAKVQLLDLPGIIEGAKDGKGRGKQVISTAGQLQPHLHSPRRDEVACAQAEDRVRARRLRDQAEQEASASIIQEEGQGRHGY